MTVTEQAPPRQRASEPRIDIDIATTRPGTPGGIFMRQFWHAVCRSSDLPGGSAKPLRIMSENFAIYRTQAGVPQVVAYRCPHRGAPLHLGWVEDEAIRCVYHGWKFDRCGQCVEQPAEEAEFARKVDEVHVAFTHQSQPICQSSPPRRPTGACCASAPAEPARCGRRCTMRRT
jgi:nitrite reductase/ring-hydroxylating ferredoxin subunit